MRDNNWIEVPPKDVWDTYFGKEAILIYAVDLDGNELITSSDSIFDTKTIKVEGFTRTYVATYWQPLPKPPAPFKLKTELVLLEGISLIVTNEPVGKDDYSLYEDREIISKRNSPYSKKDKKIIAGYNELPCILYGDFEGKLEHAYTINISGVEHKNYYTLMHKINIEPINFNVHFNLADINRFIKLGLGSNQYSNDKVTSFLNDETIEYILKPKVYEVEVEFKKHCVKIVKLL